MDLGPSGVMVAAIDGDHGCLYVARTAAGGVGKKLMAWLESTKLPFEPMPPPAKASISVAVWNILGGLEWSGLQVAAEMFGVEDIDALVRDLVTIRDFQRREE